MNSRTFVILQNTEPTVFCATLVHRGGQPLLKCLQKATMSQTMLDAFISQEWCYWDVEPKGQYPWDTGFMPYVGHCHASEYSISSEWQMLKNKAVDWDCECLIHGQQDPITRQVRWEMLTPTLKQCGTGESIVCWEPVKKVGIG